MTKTPFRTSLEKMAMQNAISRKSFGVVRSFATTHSVALTFDDGPDPKYTPALLNLLDRYNAKATFFVVGECAKAHPRILQDIRDRGHAIGNHTYHHSSFSFLSWRQRARELRQCERLIGATPRKLFRPPYGHLSRLSPFVAFLLGYDTVCWSIETRDDDIRDVDSIFDKLKRQTTGGSVILFHDRIHAAPDRRSFDREPMLNLVDGFLDYFTGIYRFKNLIEMFREAKPERVDWDIALTDEQWARRTDQLRSLIINKVVAGT